MHKLVLLAALGGVIAGGSIQAQTAPKPADCVDLKPSPAAPRAVEPSKGTGAGVEKDGPGTTGWSSGSSEAGITTEGKVTEPDAKQPETAKGLDPTKKPC